jgi:hypothetical protein
MRDVGAMAVLHDYAVTMEHKRVLISLYFCQGIDGETAGVAADLTRPGDRVPKSREPNPRELNPRRLDQ